MTTEFTHLNLRPELVQAVVDLGYQAPMPIQSAIIPVMIAGRDVIGQAQTGTGKTAAFSLPILNNLETGHGRVQALVVTPTRELAMQVASAITGYSKGTEVRVLAVYGGQPYGPQIGQIKRGVDIIVGTPGRLIDLMKRDILDLQSVRTVVLDEADEMLSMGFVEDMETILAQTPATRQTALFSATMPAEIRSLAAKYMNDPWTAAIKQDHLTVDKITQRYHLVHRTDRTAALTRLFEWEEISSALIFVRTRTETGDLANELSQRGFAAEALSGDLSQEARERVLGRFRQNQIKVLVATDVAARGLDIDDISHVFNIGLPDDAEIYVHRIGRTGRAGKTGVAITLITPAERRRLAQVEAFTRQKIAWASLPTDEEILQRREEHLMSQVKVWLQRGRARKERAMLDTLVAEGFDPMDIASAALKLARADEKQRPVAPVVMLEEFRANPRPTREDPRSRPAYKNERPFTGRNTSAHGSHEAGMVRLSLNAGKRDGIRANDIVGAIAAHANIPGYVIGKIYIQDRVSLVDIPENFAAQVLAKNGEVRIRKQPIALQIA